MTEKPKPNHYKTFLKGMKEGEDISLLAQEAKGGIAPQAASKKIREYTLEHLRSNPLTKNLVPANFEQLSDEEKEDIIKIGSQMGTRIAHETAMQAMDRNLEDIVDNNIDDKTLGILLATREVGSRINEKDQEVVTKYNEYMRYKEFSEHYEKTGEPRNQHERDIILKAAVRGYAEAEKERLAGFSDDVQNLAKAFAARSFARNHRPDTTAKYAKPGLEAQVKDKKKEYAEISKTKEREVTDIARDAIKSIKKPEKDGGLSIIEREKLYGTVYAAQSGKVKYKGPTFADYVQASASKQGDEE